MPPVGAFISGISATLSGAAIFPLGPASAFTLGAKTAAFLSTTVGGILVNAALTVASNQIARLLAGSGSRRQSNDAAVTVRLEDSERWLAVGRVRLGGAVIFAEYAEDKALWYMVAQADTDAEDVSYYLDNIPVELNEEKEVFSQEFVTFDGNKVSTSRYNSSAPEDLKRYYSLWTATPDPVLPSFPDAFLDAFPQWTDEHKMAGVTCTILRAEDVVPRARSIVYRWRGPIQTGEPSVSVLANWSRVYDPRKTGHSLTDKSTWEFGDGNPVIAWAWFRMHPNGRGKSGNSINWQKVIEAANACDELVEDRFGVFAPRYRCGIAIPDDKPRHIAEAEILLTCDGQVMFDEEGKSYVSVGQWKAPSITFTAAADIASTQTEVIDDGEAEVSGVIVEYVSPLHNYQKVSSAPWINPAYPANGNAPRYASVQVLGCQSHNQAFRLAKAIGLRSAPPQRIGVSVGVKGLLARSERIVGIDLDDQFRGAYEIVTPVELDQAGVSTSFALVPIDSGRWNVAPNDEGEPPATPDAAVIDDDVPLPENVVISAVPVNSSSGAVVRLEATFDAARPGLRFEFRYENGGEFVNMFTDMDALRSRSDVISDGDDYDVSYRGVTTGGSASEWSTPVTVTAVADTVAPAALVDTDATASLGVVTVSWQTANDEHQAAVEIVGYATIQSGPNATGQYQVSLPPDDYDFTLIPKNGSGVAGTSTTISVTVT